MRFISQHLYTVDVCTVVTMTQSPGLKGEVFTDIADLIHKEAINQSIHNLIDLNLMSCPGKSNCL